MLSRTIISLALAATAQGYKNPFYLTQVEIIDHVNSKDEVTWHAASDSVFSDWTLEEITRSLGTAVEDQPPKVVHSNDLDMFMSDKIPENYDTRDHYPHCIHHIRNQAKCGSCWAFGASEVLSDRFCMAGEDVVLSPQYLVSCDPVDMGCNGGRLMTVWEYMRFHGLPNDKCDPYSSGDGTTTTCSNTCADGSVPKMYQAKSAYSVVSWFDTEESRTKRIMAEIYKNGPVEAAFNVYQDFYNYKGGVYHHTKGPFMGGHAIKIVGYGTNEKEGDYWIVANSWGPTWGENGFFRMARGTNECNIEANVWAGLPLIN